MQKNKQRVNQQEKRSETEKRPEHAGPCKAMVRSLELVLKVIGS